MEVPAFQWSLAQSSLEAVPVDAASGKVNCTEAFEATAPAWAAWYISARPAYASLDVCML